MISRRAILGSFAAAMALPSLRAGAAEPVLTEDGIYKQPWFLESLLELADDLAGASSSKKRFAVLFELRGCPYCKEMHFGNFAQPEIEKYVRENFDILQLNIIGSREVTDFDGEKLSEKAFAAKYGVRYTPTFLFFPESAEALKAKKPAQREVTRLQGVLKPPQFLAAFRYVVEKAYDKMTLPDYLKANS
jgi:thioredoxin-related protein